MLREMYNWKTLIGSLIGTVILSLLIGGALFVAQMLDVYKQYKINMTVLITYMQNDNPRVFQAITRPAPVPVPTPAPAPAPAATSAPAVAAPAPATK